MSTFSTFEQVEPFFAEKGKSETGFGEKYYYKYRKANEKCHWIWHDKWLDWSSFKYER